MNVTTPHYPDLRGKVAVVTGGSHGIGAGCGTTTIDGGV